jgi:hypothetical protein
MEETLASMEEKYSENPFNVYEGVDRSIYYGSFALTSAAERADAMTDENTLADAFFGQDSTLARDVTLFTGGASLMLVGYAVLKISKEAAKTAAEKVTTQVSDKAMQIIQSCADKKANFVINGVTDAGAWNGTISQMSYDSYANHLIDTYFAGNPNISTSATFSDKITFLRENFEDVADDLADNTAGGVAKVNIRNDYQSFEGMNSKIMESQQAAGIKTEQPAAQTATATPNISGSRDTRKTPGWLISRNRSSAFPQKKSRTSSKARLEIHFIRRAFTSVKDLSRPISDAICQPNTREV